MSEPKDCIFRFNANGEIVYTLEDKEDNTSEAIQIEPSGYKIIVVNTNTNPHTILELTTSDLSGVFSSTVLELISNAQF